MTTFRGEKVTLVGKRVQVGEVVPDFSLMTRELTHQGLADFAGKKKVISVVPSIDTGICSVQTRTFNKALSDRDDTVVITISEDLPFAQARWCGAAGIDKVVTLSDYKSNSFGQAYGVLIKEFQLDMRSIFVLDANNKITYVEYLTEMSEHPNYEAAIQAVKELL